MIKLFMETETREMKRNSHFLFELFPPFLCLQNTAYVVEGLATAASAYVQGLPASKRKCLNLGVRQMW